MIEVVGIGFFGVNPNIFLLKKIVGSFFQPIPLCLFLLLLGLAFMIFTRKKKTGKVLVCAGTLVLAIFSYGGVSDLFIRPLERQYPPISDFQSLKGVKWVVVLGGGREAHGAKRKEPSVKRRYKTRVVGGAVAEDLFERGLCLPSGTAMTRQDH